MADVLIEVKLVNGRVECSPVNPTLKPDDVVRWRSSEGAIEIDFSPNRPFLEPRMVWSAPKDVATTPATVAQGSKTTLFVPKVSLIANQVVSASGQDVGCVDIP